MSEKGTYVPAATCLFIVITGHCSLNSATCHTWIMKSAPFLWYSSVHSWHCQLMMVKIVRFPLGRRAYYEFKRRQNEMWHRPAMITASSNSQICVMSSASSHSHHQNIALQWRGWQVLCFWLSHIMNAVLWVIIILIFNLLAPELFF